MKNLAQWKQLWTRLTAKQRAIAGGGTLAALIAMGLLIRTMGTPDMKPLMTGLEAEDAQTIGQQLTAMKIQYRLSPDGKQIDVDADKLDEARMQVAAQGTAHSGRMGFEIFDKTSWGQTEFDEKVNYQRALEGELERTIGTLNGVKSARVHLVLSHSSVFMEKERAAKASVTLRLKRGRMSDLQLQAIARLVSGAVDDLAPEDVAIIDADNNQPLNTHSGSAEGRELEAELTKRLMDTLGPVVGLQNLRASVNVEYDLRSSEQNEDEYDPSVSALLTTQKTAEQSSNGVGEAGVAGTSSNLPGSAAQKGAVNLSGVGPTQTSTSENSSFGVNKIERHLVSPAGSIRRVTAAILVNDGSSRKIVDGKLVGDTYKRSPMQLGQLQTLASAVLGVDPQRGDVVTVQNMTFAGEDEIDLPQSTADRVQHALTQFATPLRYVSILLLFLLAWGLIVRPMQKQLVRSMTPTEVKELPVPVDDTWIPTVKAGDPVPQLLEPDVTSVGLKQQLSDMVQAEPAAMARTVQSWLQGA